MKGPTTQSIAMVLLAASVCLFGPPAAAFLSGDNGPSEPTSVPPTAETDTFDGRWTFTSAGCRYTGSIGAIIKHGRVIVRGGGGQVDPDGAIHTVGAGGA